MGETEVEDRLLLSVEMILHVQMGTIHDVHSLWCMYYSTNTLIQTRLPLVTWDPLGLGDDQVSAAEVVATEIMQEGICIPIATLGIHKESCNSQPKDKLLLQCDRE